MTETVQSTLANFLLARIAEDEAVVHHSHSHDNGLHSFLSAHETGGILVFPSRVRAECEAKRRMIGASRAAPWPMLMLLALPYADHPDYREEWRV